MDSQGNKLGSGDILVNSVVQGDQLDPSINAIFDTSGKSAEEGGVSLIISWVGKDDSNEGIKAQKFVLDRCGSAGECENSMFGSICWDGSYPPGNSCCANLEECPLNCVNLPEINNDFDADSDGFTDTEDCEPMNPDVNPCAAEICNDSIDNNCDGYIDEDDMSCTDDDYDSFPDSMDCEPNNPNINPYAPEICDDNIDNNCDGDIDEDDASCTDDDYDGFLDSTDCEPNNPNINPGVIEICDDEIDNNCDGFIDRDDPFCTDYDYDGYADSTDCEPSNPNVNPGVEEICDDGIDNNCDGMIDADDLSCTDDDHDGFPDV
eukprot:UN27963